MRLELNIGNKYPEISGPLSDAFAAELQQAVLSGDVTELILDFEGTRTISSMAMGVLFATHQKMREEGKTMRVVNASDKVKHLLRLVNMMEILF